MTESGNVTLCADQVSPGIFAFNGLQDSTVAVEIIGVFQIVYTDLEAHDTIESALFTIILILGLVVWTGATKGGMLLKRSDLRPPSKMQKLVVADVSMSILATICYSVHDHGLSLLPFELSYSIGDEYGSVLVSLYVFLQTLLTAFISALLMLELTKDSYLELMMLRVLVELQLLISLHFHFPVAFGTMLRELVGLFISITSLVICGRDFAILFSRRPIKRWHWLLAVTFILSLHHVIVAGFYGTAQVIARWNASY